MEEDIFSLTVMEVTCLNCIDVYSVASELRTYWDLGPVILSSVELSARSK